MPGAPDRRRHGRAAAISGAVLAAGLLLMATTGGAADAETAADAEPGAVAADRARRESPFSTHHANYLVIGPEDSPVAGNTTTKFQLSLKYDTGAHWYLAYNQRVFWDIVKPSGPVLDMSFEPEVFYAWRPRFAAAGRWGLESMRLGFSHESNGKRGSDSRAWNRAYAEPRFHWQGFVLEPKVWAIFSKDDQNRDIADYYGYADLAIGYETRTGQKYRLTGRQGAQHGSVQFDLSLPVQSLFPGYRMRPNLYFQAWHGYGETLLYYDLQTTAVRVGIEFRP